MICFGPALSVPNMPVSQVDREPAVNPRVPMTAYALRLMLPILTLLVCSLA